MAVLSSDDLGVIRDNEGGNLNLIATSMRVGARSILKHIGSPLESQAGNLSNFYVPPALVCDTYGLSIEDLERLVEARGEGVYSLQKAAEVIGITRITFYYRGYTPILMRGHTIKRYFHPDLIWEHFTRFEDL